MLLLPEHNRSPHALPPHPPQPHHLPQRLQHHPHLRPLSPSPNLHRLRPPVHPSRVDQLRLRPTVQASSLKASIGLAPTSLSRPALRCGTATKSSNGASNGASKRYAFHAFHASHFPSFSVACSRFPPAYRTPLPTHTRRLPSARKREGKGKAESSACESTVLVVLRPRFQKEPNGALARRCRVAHTGLQGGHTRCARVHSILYLNSA